MTEIEKFINDNKDWFMQVAADFFINTTKMSEDTLFKFQSEPIKFSIKERKEGDSINFCPKCKINYLHITKIDNDYVYYFCPFCGKESKISGSFLLKNYMQNN